MSPHLKRITLHSGVIAPATSALCYSNSLKINTLRYVLFEDMPRNGIPAYQDMAQNILSRLTHSVFKRKSISNVAVIMCAIWDCEPDSFHVPKWYY